MEDVEDDLERKLIMERKRIDRKTRYSVILFQNEDHSLFIQAREQEVQARLE